jgi:hypothetical protein
MLVTRVPALSILLVALSWSSVASAVPIVVKNIATGIDDVTGQKLAYLTPDNDYVIGAGSPEGVGFVPHAFQLGHDWFGDGASSSSRWIAIDISHPESAHPQNGAMALPGIYSFITTVDLTGFYAASAQIEDIRYAADNALVELIVNGTSVFSDYHDPCIPFCGGGFLGFQSLGTRGAGLMQSGLNEIEFRVSNYYHETGDANPMGFRVEGLVTAEVVPEPNTALLLGLGLVALSATQRGQRCVR